MKVPNLLALFAACFVVASPALAEEAPTKLTVSRSRPAEAVAIYSQTEASTSAPALAPSKLTVSRSRPVQSETMYSQTETATPTTELAPTKLTVSRQRPARDTLETGAAGPEPK